MENILPIHLQEVVFSSSDPKVSGQISKLVQDGKLRKISGRIYTSNFSDNPENIVKRNLFEIMGKLYPGALLSHRSALEFRPTSLGYLFVTYTYTKRIELPGITLRFMTGKGPIEGDNPLSGDLYASQLERALLENLQTSRQPGAKSKTLSLPELENRLEEVVRVKGEKGLNELRDRARGISDKLAMEKEFQKLNKLVSAMLNTAPSKALTSPLALARAFGNPYDSARIALFEELFVKLKQGVFKERNERNQTEKSYKNFAFFEAYFSNYIEGTEFELGEAKQIIETSTPIYARDEDSHDILGTYKLVSNITEMKVVPSTPEELIEILLYRHGVLLSARKSKNPGQFKNKNNRAGETHFVDKELVKGTLIKGFDYYNALTDPFAKAVYIMFMVSEIHPFLDGNGRIARVMMNAELTNAGHTKIIIPNVYRDDYIGALRRLTRQRDAQVYIRMMDRAQEFSSSIVGEDMDAIEKHLDKCQAFSDHTQGKLIIREM